MVEKIVLINDLTVVLEEVPFSHSICMGSWANIGSRHDPRGFNGLAHFIEHMLFKGSDRMTPSNVADRMDLVGGQINALTAKEYTCFYTRTLDEHFDKAIEVINLMTDFPLFTQADVEKERMVINQEIAMYENSPEDTLHNLMQYHVWEGDPLGNPIMGTRDSISGMTGEFMRNYYTCMYGTENSVISVAGNFKVQEMAQKLDNIYRGPKPIPTLKGPEFTTKYKRVRAIVEKDYEQAFIMLSFPSYGLGHPDAYTLSLISTIFAGGVNSRLFRSMRESGLAYSVYSNISSFTGDAGIFSIYAAVDRNKCKEAVRLILKELQNLYINPITEEQLYRKKEQMKSSYMLGSENIISRMTGNAKSQLLLGRTISSADVLKTINKITLSDFYRVADDILKLSDMSMMIMGNVPDINLDSLVEDGYEILYK